jgi:hypothetical protein
LFHGEEEKVRREGGDTAGAGSVGRSAPAEDGEHGADDDRGEGDRHFLLLLLTKMASANLTQERRVLSVQSHVVSGFVGTTTTLLVLVFLV